MKASFTFRVYLMSEDKRKSAMKASFTFRVYPMSEDKRKSAMRNKMPPDKEWTEPSVPDGR